MAKLVWKPVGNQVGKTPPSLKSEMSKGYMFNVKVNEK